MDPSKESPKKSEEKTETPKDEHTNNDQPQDAKEDQRGVDMIKIMEESKDNEQNAFGYNHFKKSTSKPLNFASHWDADSAMTNISVEKLSLVDGAEELDLPDEAAVILDDLRNEIQKITPTVKKEGVKILYSYGTPESCGKLSSAIGHHKVRAHNNIKASFANYTWRPRKSEKFYLQCS
ncbi:hypothetical protein FALBO_3023 [Fusarium albosuccineum]|uniref:Uncharacterized protein n=1 Tax=Fusarium albosuccineum TaxID=1237068 RepID=A0A8H4LL05_9HYPO|nr:hypothetical protein FALBO_3023 [Fusarium albosuccineum]